MPSRVGADLAFVVDGRPTKEGRAVLDRIAGFKQYLSITERERLDRMQAPEDTLNLFERYLPYAIALGVENRWADRFQSLLAAARRLRAPPKGFWLVFAASRARGTTPAASSARSAIVAGQHDQLRLDRPGSTAVGRRRVRREVAAVAVAAAEAGSQPWRAGRRKIAIGSPL